MALFVGLDVSLNTTSICIVEANGKLVWEGKALSEPVPLLKALAPWRKRIKLIGIEACSLSEWLYGALVESKLETVCIETRHTQRFLSSRPSKTDRSDARGIGDMMRFGHFKPVHVKSRPSLLIRTTLIARKKFVDHMLSIELTIRGLLKVHGLKIGAVHRCTFSANVELLLADAPELHAATRPCLKCATLGGSKRCTGPTETSNGAQRRSLQALMTVPGVGPIISLAYKATIDDPNRFKSSKAVAAHISLTPRVYQSGEIDRSGNISKCGDKLL